MWWLNETTRFKLKNLRGTIPREQSAISNWDLRSRIPIRYKSNIVTKLGFELLRLFWSGSTFTWKSNINSESRWKSIRGWPHQHFVKML